MPAAIDAVTPRRLEGWAADAEGRPEQLSVKLNGQSVLGQVSRRRRPDLTPLLGEAAAAELGFTIELTSPIRTGDILELNGARGAPVASTPVKVEVVGGGKVDKALALADKSMRILEIGPSFSPTAPRTGGWNSFSLDHATQEELRAKYRGQQAIENIEPVDFVWKGGLVADAVPEDLHRQFDMVIASHVIEHFPDTIGFYQSAARLLKPGGLISLVVPDKRVMFDFFKPLSLTSDLLEAHTQRRSRHSKKTAFDNIAYNAFESGDVAWAPRAMGDFMFPGASDTLHQALQVFDGKVEDDSGPYIDFHNTIYTPSSFELIILELGQLGVIPFKMALSYPSQGCEFYVTLRKEAPSALGVHDLGAERLRLMKQTVRELGQQALWLTS